jgi:predicted dehydrogenase
MAQGKLDVKPLISHRIPQRQASEAYRLLTEDPSTLGILLTYPDSGVDLDHTVESVPPVSLSPCLPVSQAVVGVIGAGNFASLVLLPALSKTSARLKTIASGNGMTAAVAARKFGFQYATSDYLTILDDPEINTVFIATRHNTHARMVVEALKAGKHVFVEKPLALNVEELHAVAEAYRKAEVLSGAKEQEQRSGGAGEQGSVGAEEQGSRGARELGSKGEHPSTLAPVHPCTHAPLLMVGFNRRFSPLAVKMQALLAERSEPLSVIYTVNAGAVPVNHWTQDPEIGGGRIIGEGCHFIDFIRFLVGHPIVGVEARMMGAAPGVAVRQDKMMILLEFADGSIGAVHYLANGNKSFPKERVEVFSEGRVLVLDNFQVLTGYGWKGFKRQRLWRQDKGHKAEVAAFIERVMDGGPPLIPWHELEEVTLATFAAVERAMESPRPLHRLDC